jgi:Cu(I)/Ag(I) efflux system membrane fusion protein
MRVPFQLTVAFAALLLAVTSCAAANNSPRPSDVSVLDSYQKIQLALASDSLKEIPENGEAVAKAVKNDPDKRIPIDVAKYADQLAKDKDLKTARDDFKNLSAALISYLEKSNIKGAGYQEKYCPMVKASWLQKDKKVNNPYVGKSMATCGTPKRSF